MISRTLLFISLILLLACETSFSQNAADSAKVTRIETTDGNIFTGSVVSEDSVSVVLKTGTLGEVRIPRNTILSVREFRNVPNIKNQFWLPDPQTSRYYWAPSGYGLKKGEAYYQNIWILYNQVSCAVTNNFSLGGGLIPLFFFGGTATPVWIIPKFSIPVVKDAFNIGTGALIGTVAGGGEGGGVFGLLFGTATFGSRDRNLSIGLAYGFAGGEITRTPVFNLSGMLRVGPKGYIMTENYVITIEGETAVLISGGGRTIVKNIGIDYSLWVPIVKDLDTFAVIPFLGINIPIGSKR